MRDERIRMLLVLCGLMIVGGLIGWVSAPWLARQNYIVEVAERVWLEESGQITGEVDQSEAFRRTGGIPLEELYAEAHRIRGQFFVGATLLGVFLGMVIGLKALGLVLEPERSEYEADPALCLACARCFEACPVEHERRGIIPCAEAAVAPSPPSQESPTDA